MSDGSREDNMVGSSLDTLSSSSDPTSATTPAFELVVLGSGGGPLETDTSGYLLKPFSSSWEDGILALEGGSGLGALAALFERVDPSTLFPTLHFPSSHNSPILKAAYVFSFLSCYLVTHAHLDHCHSLVLLSGSVPPRPIFPSRRRSSAHLHEPDIDRLTSVTSASALQPAVSQPRPPVYAARRTLERLSLAYGGGLWPELSTWAPERDPVAAGKKRRLKRKESLTDDADQLGSGAGTGVELTPISESDHYFLLHPTLPFSIMKFHTLHGCTSQGNYESSTLFLRYDPKLHNESDYSMSGKPVSTTSSTTKATESTTSQDDPALREFVFFGDVESDWRKKGEEDWDVPSQEMARDLNGKIWEAAARSWDKGRLAGVFLECSYDSDRPAHLMFGHLHPPSLYHEISKLAKKVTSSSDSKPLKGLKVFIIHIKDELVPHPSGRTPRQRIMPELEALERAGQLGVEFVEVKQGDRILL